MLAELENELIALVKASPLAARLKMVDSVPDLDADTLVKKFLTSAPAVYVAATPFTVSEGRAKVRFGLAGVAVNARGQKAARQGDASAIGMYEIVDALAILLDGAGTASTSWGVTGVNFINDDQFHRNGLYVGAVTVEGLVGLDKDIDGSTLDDFLKAFVTYDLAPADAVIEAEDRIDLPQ